LKERRRKASHHQENLDDDPRRGEKTEDYLGRACASPPGVIELARKLLSE
jgi:hypothetical protein